MPSPSNHLDNETVIVFHLLYIYFITVHQNMMYTDRDVEYVKVRRKNKENLYIWPCYSKK